MAGQKLSDLTELNTKPETTDVLLVIDKSDTTMGPTGTNKKIKHEKVVEGLAKSGDNTDITKLSGLTTPLTISRGGTDATTAGSARANLNVYSKEDTYDKDEVDALVGDKADQSTTYTKTETDNLLDTKEDVGVAYTKGETDTLLSGKSDTTHSHTGVYAPFSHTHSEYSLTTHDHEGIYQPYSSNLDDWASLTPPASDVVGTQDNQDIENKNILKLVYKKTEDFILIKDESGQILEIDSADQLTITIPSHDDVTFAQGVVFDIVKIGDGDVLIEGATGVTLNGVLAGSGTITIKWAKGVLYQTALDEWVLLKSGNDWDTLTPPTSDVVGIEDYQTLQNKIIQKGVFNETTDFQLGTESIGQILEIESAETKTVTIPHHDTVEFDIGMTIEVIKTGDGDVFIEGESTDVIVNGVAMGNYTITDKWSKVTIYQRLLNEWVILTGGSGGAIQQIPLLVTANINLNSETAQDLYTVPEGKQLIIEELILRHGEVFENITSTVSAGYNDPDYNDVAASGSQLLYFPEKYYKMIWNWGSENTVGDENMTLKFKDTEASGVDNISTVDVIGYLIDKVAPPPEPPEGITREVTIDYTKVGGTDVDNYQMLFRGTWTWMKTVANGGGVQNANGWDVRFYADQYCTEQLPHQWIAYNAISGSYHGWVKLPKVLTGLPTKFYVNYGRPEITTDQSNRQGVFPSSQFYHWHHFQTLPAGWEDASESDRALSVVMGSPYTSAEQGKIGNVLWNNGYDQSLTVNTTGYPTGNMPYTMAMWFRFTDSPTGTQYYGMYYYGANVLNQFMGLFQYESQARAYFNGSWISTPTIAQNTWHRGIVTYDGTVGRLYVNGVEIGNITATANLVNDIMRLGQARAIYTGRQTVYDEVSLAKEAISASRVLTDYNNQNAHATFFSVGDVITF